MALTKIPRGLLDTGIADSSDATAITIAANEDITLAGRVGIAVAPSYTFTVEKAITDDWLSRIYNTGTAEGDMGVLIRTGSEHDGTSILSLYSGSSYKFKFQADGKLGIGTDFTGGNASSIMTAPLNIKLTSGSSAAAATFNLEHSNSSANIEQRLQFNAGDDATADSYSNMGYVAFGKENAYVTDDTRDSYLSFATSTNAVQAERMRITSAGKVGIGTTSPTGLPLHLKVSSGDNKLQMQTANKNAYVMELEDSTGNLKLGTNTTAGALVIADGGNVSIGTTSATEVLNLYAPNNTSGGIEIAGNANTLGSTSMFVGQGSGGQGYLWQRANNYLMIATNNTERMRVDASGYVQFGASVTTHVGTSQVFINRGVNASAVTSGTTQTGAALRLRGGDNAILDMGMNSVNTWIQATDRANLANLYHIALNPNGGAVSVGNYSTSDRFEVYKNTNGNFATYIAQDNVGGYGMGVRGDGGSMIYFYIGGTYQGHIYSSGGSTTYGTGSDYRLKNNVAEMSGSIDKLKKLRPVTFNFKESPDVPQQGFIAHEAQEVVPHAVAGEKDAKIDEEHQIGYQSMEYGKVTPLLTAALQEALAKIETLETKVAALESK